MDHRPQLYDGELPFFLIDPRDRHEVVRLFARSGVGLILSDESKNLTRVEMPGYSFKSASIVAARVLRGFPRRTVLQVATDVLDLPRAPIGALRSLIVPDRFAVSGLLHE
jgi:hypothetical protein